MAQVKPDAVQLRALVRALRAEADGKALRRDLVRGLRAVVTPAAQAARASILAMGVHGRDQAEPGLRASIARATKVTVRTAGKRAGVAVRVKKTSMPRGFRNAPKRLNAKKGWRHPVFKTGVWVTQRGKPGWFDDTLRDAQPAAAAAAKEAMDNIADRISARTRG